MERIYARTAAAILASAALLVAVLPAVRAISRPPEATGGFQIGLQDYGWRNPPPPGEFFWPSPSLAVDEEGRVLVSFTTGGAVRLATRQHPGLTFHILRFSGAGRPDLDFAVPTDNYHGNGIYLDQRGDIIARVNRKLQILSAEYVRQAAPHNWKALASCGSDCRIVQSPSRRTLFFGVFSVAPGGYWASLSVLRFDPGNGQRASETCRERAPDFSLAVGDEFMYRTIGGGYGMPSPKLVRWPLCAYEQKTESRAAAAGSVWPLNDKTVAITGVESDGDDAIAVQAATGQVRFIVKVPKNDEVENVLASNEDGSRFAVSISRWRGGSRWLDISGHVASRSVVVYSARTGQKLASIAISPRPFGPGGGPAIAMSPNGSVVAALVDGILTVAKVP